jgi:hypothetical protein
MNSMRRVQYQTGDQWTNIEFTDIEQGMTVRVFEDDGSMMTIEGESVFIAGTNTFARKPNEPIIMLLKKFKSEGW